MWKELTQAIDQFDTTVDWMGIRAVKEVASDYYRDWETDRKSTRLNSSH